MHIWNWLETMTDSEKASEDEISVISEPETLDGRLEHNGIDEKKNIEELEREVSVLKSKLKVFENPTDLTLFNFKVHSNRYVKLNLFPQLSIPSHTIYAIIKEFRETKQQITIFRRFSDFLHLRSIFKKQFKFILIPYAPPKKKLNKSSTFIKFRLTHLNMFIQTLLVHPLLKDTQILKQFLNLSNVEWNQVIEQHDLEDGSEGYIEKARSYFFSQITNISKMTQFKSEADQQVESNGAVDEKNDSKSFLKLEKRFEEGFKFSYVDGISEHKIETNLKEVFESVTQNFKNFYKCYASLSKGKNQLSKDTIHLGMIYGSSDLAHGPHLFTMLQNFSNAISQDHFILSNFCLNTSGIELVKDKASVDFTERLLDKTYQNLCIAADFPRFLESNRQLVTMSKTEVEGEKEVTGDINVSNVLETSRNQIDWALDEVEKNMNLILIKDFQQNMHKMYTSRVKIYEDLLKTLE